MNEREANHIVTIEDPLEYIIEIKASIINQRELSLDFPSFSASLRAVFMEDLYIIMIVGM